MNRKRKKPFAGKTNPAGNNTKTTENMSREELTEELRAMEKALGKKRFNSLLEEAIQNLEIQRMVKTGILMMMGIATILTL